ncbi:MAG: UvrB/UvrC motif-containing protein [Minisyncoccia bacterium]
MRQWKTLPQLREMQRRAVAEEQYEYAGKIRDRINEISV